MKILIVSDAWKPQLNGVVRTYEHIGRVLEAQGHDFKVIGPRDFPLRFSCPGYKEIDIAIFTKRRLKQYIQDFAPDEIHIATEGPLGRTARKYCLKNNLIFTSCYHTQFPDYLAKRVAKIIPFLYRLTHQLTVASLRRFHNKSSAIMVATQSLEDELKQWGFTAPMHRLTRGAEIDIFYPAKTEADKTAFQDLEKPVALYVGRVAIEKNLEAFLQMDWGGSKVIIGDGPSLNDLKAKYPRVVFAGKKTGADLGAHYRSADIFVFPSKTDTFGMVLVEAMASGLPVAAYNVSGPKDIITESFLGVLTDDDLADAADKCLPIAAQKDRRHQYANDHYTWDVAGAQFIEILKMSRQ